MHKGTTKSRISVTIDSKLLEKLQSRLKKKMIKTSTYIEYLIERDIKNEK
ncbi:hypothetical protein H6503_00435 [Candidatus Woesearchaeota archaeon]|nr:hypothetical protein [Candidatus Woesearchaeota archaeon]